MDPKVKEAFIGPVCLHSLNHAFDKLNNPRKTLFRIHNLIGELTSQLDEMLGVMASEDEDIIEDGEGRRGTGEEALSGIKLYKGETLVELTERWKFIHKKLYNNKKETFDLTRIPDIHDNVRFDMLHNRHLGLTSTLQKLYQLAKLMADCVVPQEYGTSIENKRSIGSKMCHNLLDKIKNDLIIARTDNQTDMRYMINMDYSADLPINTLGRRIRTRLYFTSESHLHTLLNVLRFPDSSPGSSLSPLSQQGKFLIADAPELCYLTQVTIRLFEDTKKDMNDSTRFRIEIMFSPGATATPIHMAEMKRDMDTSRFDTDSLSVISKDNLTCQEIENYFDECIRKGKKVEDKLSQTQASDTAPSAPPEKTKNAHSPKQFPHKGKPEDTSCDTGKGNYNKSYSICRSPTLQRNVSHLLNDEEDNTNDQHILNKHKVEKFSGLLARRYFMKGFGIMLGLGCLLIAKRVRDDFSTLRIWTKR